METYGKGASEPFQSEFLGLGDDRCRVVQLVSCFLLDRYMFLLLTNNICNTGRRPIKCRFYCKREQQHGGLSVVAYTAERNL